MAARAILGALLPFVLTGASALAQEDGPLWPRVHALFLDRCIACHSGEYAPLGLSLDSHAGVLGGSENGPVLFPEAPDTSPILRRLRGEAEPRMPLDGPPFLDEAQIALVAAWIAAGAPEDGAAPTAAPEPEAEPEGPPNFARIEPILKQRCIVCHSDNSRYPAPPEGLRLTDHAAVLAGGDRVVVIPGNPEASEIWRRVTGHAQPRMPFDGPPWLPEDQIALIRDWIAAGAPDAAGRPAPLPVGGQVRYRGRMTAPDEIDGVFFLVDGNTRIEDALDPGQAAELRGTVTETGAIRATRLRAR